MQPMTSPLVCNFSQTRSRQSWHLDPRTGHSATTRLPCCIRVKARHPSSSQKSLIRHLSLTPMKSGPTASLQMPGYARPNGQRWRTTRTAAMTAAPAGDMPTAQAMAQSFSLANMVPQAPEHNRGVWAKSVEMATRSYVKRATGDVYVITGPVYVPSIAQSPGIGPGQVRVPRYLFKLVYDQSRNRAWAYWHENNDATRASRPISYADLVKRTGISFLPGANPGD